MTLERGNKLWEGHRVILPEYEQLVQKEQRKKEVYQPPELDSQAIEEISRMIHYSLQEEQAIEVTFATKKGPAKFIGFVIRVDAVERWMIMKNGEDKRLIPFSIVLNAEVPPEDE